jgi:carbonic anhydrase
MSCPNATAPIDISMSKIIGKCDLKCSYSFHYSTSSCVATNRGDYISISYDKSSSPPVSYNATAYDVQEIRLYTPSLHSYNNTKTDGELIIVHTSNMGYNPLLVCIPIKSNNTSSISASFFKTLIDTVASNAPSEGETTTVNVPKFNLDYLVPKRPFFSYSATEPYQPCSSDVEYIVFSPLEASLDIMPESLTTLQSVIASNPYDIKTGPNLFFNEKGSRMGGADGGEIYIDCQPVGSSDETTEIITDIGNSSYPTNISDWLKNPLFKLILGSFVFIFILYFVKYLLNMFKPTKGGAVETVTEGIKGGGKWRK